MGVAGGAKLSKPSNLIFCYDAANPKSYSGSGTTVYDVIQQVSATITNGASFSTNNAGYLNFDGSNDYLAVGDTPLVDNLTGDATWEVLFKSDVHNVRCNVYNKSYHGTGTITNETYDHTIENGLTKTITNMVVNGLNSLDVTDRPIHCTDSNRKVLYVKEADKWEKDNENKDKIKSALRRIEQKNIMQIPLWIKAHPNCIISSNRENTPYLKMVMQSTGGENPDETADMAKIITNIAKETVIIK